MGARYKVRVRAKKKMLKEEGHYAGYPPEPESQSPPSLWGNHLHQKRLKSGKFRKKRMNQRIHDLEKEP